MKSLRSAFATLQEEKVQVIGVSMDSVEAQRAFSDKFRLPFVLLSDQSGEICEAFRVVHPGGKPRRESFLFQEGRLVHHDRAVEPSRQADDVRRAIARLRDGGPTE